MKTITVKIPDELLETIKQERHKPYTQVYEELGRAVATAVMLDMKRVVVVRTPTVINCPECGSDNTARYMPNVPTEGLYDFVCKDCRLRWQSHHKFAYPDVEVAHQSDEAVPRSHLTEGRYVHTEDELGRIISGDQ